MGQLPHNTRPPSISYLHHLPDASGSQDGHFRAAHMCRYVRVPALALVLAEGVESIVLVLRLVEVRLCLLVPGRWPHGLATC